ncbi:Uu.00g122730.m01.CDS01 [Anthostomella pinea]|uniref:Riboflavin kinase n=1 Tax=Anthostomella pinea TaxID=933095 RepID=A0AAI8VH61_9PEZI|nr:Uu.00g122730.m01.CDS01 [Anthostomella pinea]
MASQRPRILYPDAGPEPPYPLRMEGTVISGFGRGSKELGIPTANLPVDTTATPWIADAKSGVYFGWASLALPGSHADHPGNGGKIRPVTTTITAGAHEGSDAAAPAETAAKSETSDGLTSPPLVTTEISISTSTSSDAPSTTPPTNTPSTTQDPSTTTPSSTTPNRQYHIYPMVMSIGYNPFYKNSIRSAEVHVLHKFAADFYGVPMRLLILGFVREERDYSGLEALVEDINIDCDVARQSLARAAWTPREGVVVGGVGAGAVAGEAGSGTLDGGWLVRED